MWYSVFSSGRAGSAWLVKILTEPESDAVAFHDPLRSLLGDATLTGGSAWWDQAQRLHSRWIARVRATHRSVGEVHIGNWDYWIGHRDEVPPTRCLVVRSGINVVHSLTRLIRRGVFLDPAPDPNGADLFERLCGYWAEQVDFAAALDPLPTCRLEDLVTDPAALQQLFAKVGLPVPAEPQCRALQGVVANRAFEGDVSPGNLFWNVWSPAERETFTCRCAGAMAVFGYEIPAAAPAVDRVAAEPSDGYVRASTLTSRRLEAFLDRTVPGPVVVVGAQRQAELAAHALGALRCSVDELPALHPALVLVVEDEHTESTLARVRPWAGGAEVVRLAADDLNVPDPPAPAPVTSAAGLHVGDVVADGWRVTGFAPAEDPGLAIRLADARGREIVLELVGPGAKPGPFAVGAASLRYLCTEIAFGELRAAGEELARRLGAAYAGQSWEAVLASLPFRDG